MNKNKVGLGTFPLSGVFNEIDPKDAEKVISHFLDHGGYYIDTAPMYGNGEIESLLGRVLKSYPRDAYYLISKTVYNIDESGNLFKSGKYQDIVEQIDNSLKRLGVDYLDQLMVHSPDGNVEIEETLKAIEYLQEGGKAKELSVSNVNLKELKEFNKSAKIKYVENRFSFISRSISLEFEKYLVDNNIKLIPYHLLEIGLLTDTALTNFELRAGDLREKLPYWNKENRDVISEFVRTKLAPIARKSNCTIGQLSIAWALSQKFIDIVIVGTTKPEYVDINLQSNNIKLDNEILVELEEIYSDFESEIKEKYRKSMREFRGLNEKYY